MTDKTLTRAAVIPAGASTLNAEQRTVEVCWTSGAAVKRYDWDNGFYMEELEVSPKAIRMDRFASMSLLDGHEQSMSARIGTIIAGSVCIAGGKAYATIKFSRHEAAERVLTDLVDGHPINISVGYKIHSSTKVEGERGQLPTLRAIDWEPMELSVVAVPADPAATSRSEEDSYMPNQARQQGVLTPSEIVEQQRHATELERARMNEIRAAARLAGYDSDTDFVQTALENDVTVEQFRSTLLDKVLAGGGSRSPKVDTYRKQDSNDTRRRLAANAILHRHGIVQSLEDGANEWRGMTAMDIAKETLKQRGEDHRGAPAEVLQRALHTTSDFAAILNAVTHQSLISGYTGYENTFQLIANRNVVNDFREQKLIDIGAAPDLLPVNEHGEFRSGTIRESEESVRVQTFGRTISLTRQMLINDSLGAFTRMISNWGRKVAKLEGDIVWGVVIDNMKLKDGKGLFHQDHGNLAIFDPETEAAKGQLTEASLVEARRAYRRQKDIDGQPIDMTPKFLFVGADLEIAAQKLITGTTVPTTTADVVPQAIKSMVPVYEPRLDAQGGAWFLFADAADTLGRGLQYIYLAGNELPHFKERIGFDVDGIDYKIRHDFGAGLTDYRFAYKNPGMLETVAPAEESTE